MKYVLAVSGGVDSVVLLDMIAHDGTFKKLHFGGASWPEDFIVAHFDHGIRPESGNDAEFVRQLSSDYTVEFVGDAENLGLDASEALARSRRYEFLQSVADRFTDAKIVTAHHQDDLLETIVMNLIRGTGWRGLAPMANGIVRPLLGQSKAEIVSYAIDHDLQWRDDPTNFSAKYFRNRVRNVTASMLPNDRRKLLDYYVRQRRVRDDIELEIQKTHNSVAEVKSDTIKIRRYFLIMIPDGVAIELLGRVTERLLTRPQLRRLLLFARAARSGKRQSFDALKASVDQKFVTINKLR